MPAEKRVAIVGAGTMGAFSAWYLSETTGLAVTAYDQFSPPHDRSAHAGHGRFFRMAYKEGREYIPLLKQAREEWLRLNSLTGTPVFRPSNYLTIGATSLADIRELLDGSDAYGLRTEQISGRDFTDRFPQHRPLFDDEVAALDTDGGVLDPELAIRGALDIAQANGVDVRPYTPVLDIEPMDSGARVVTADSTDDYDFVIVTVGAWAAKFGLTRALPIRPNQLYHTWYYTRKPELFNFETFPAFNRQSPGLEELMKGLSGTPSPDGKIIKLGQAVPRLDPKDPDELDRQPPVSYLKFMREALLEFLPDVVPDPIRSAVYIDGYTPDNKAFVEFAAPHILTMTGFSGHGFKFAPIMGKLAAQAVLTGQIPDELSTFGSSRLDQDAAQPKE